jgi:hypothetical protein
MLIDPAIITLAILFCHYSILSYYYLILCLTMRYKLNMAIEPFEAYAKFDPDHPIAGGHYSPEERIITPTPAVLHLKDVCASFLKPDWEYRTAYFGQGISYNPIEGQDILSYIFENPNRLGVRMDYSPDNLDLCLKPGFETFDDADWGPDARVLPPTARALVSQALKQTQVPYLCTEVRAQFNELKTTTTPIRDYFQTGVIAMEIVLADPREELKELAYTRRSLERRLREVNAEIPTILDATMRPGRLLDI